MLFSAVEHFGEQGRIGDRIDFFAGDIGPGVRVAFHIQAAGRIVNGEKRIFCIITGLGPRRNEDSLVWRGCCGICFRIRVFGRSALPARGIFPLGWDRPGLRIHPDHHRGKRRGLRLLRRDIDHGYRRGTAAGRAGTAAGRRGNGDRLLRLYGRLGLGLRLRLRLRLHHDGRGFTGCCVCRGIVVLRRDIHRVGRRIRLRFGTEAVYRGIFANSGLKPVEGGVNDGNYLMMGGYRQ